jgi:hypothetical protein
VWLKYHQSVVTPGNALTLIGLISDTHGLLRPEALQALQDSHLIIHAGDIGDPELLTKLSSIAPVVTVRGNVDTRRWAADLPETAVAEAGDVLLYVLHDVKRTGFEPASCGLRNGRERKLAPTRRKNGTVFSISIQGVPGRAAFVCPLPWRVWIWRKSRGRPNSSDWTKIRTRSTDIFNHDWSAQHKKGEWARIPTRPCCFVLVSDETGL